VTAHLRGRLWRIALIALCAVGCERKSEPPPPAATVATPSTEPAQPAAPAAAPLGAAAPAPADGIPTEEDFEEQAEREISAANLEAELDKLEREIGDSSP
jgi:hypothetical protein